MEVSGLWRYPVKSLQGERLETAVFAADGMVGDRQWGIRDGLTGRILTARRRPELLAASASLQEDLPLVTIPDGRSTLGPGHGTDELLSEWLGSPVSLVSAVGAEGGRAEFFEDATDDASEAIEWTMPVGRYVDAAAVLVLTSASLRAGAALHPDGTWRPERFRPNVLVEVASDGWVEDGWIGQRVQAGAATLAPLEGCVRCTMVTRPQPGLEADVEVFRTLARHHGARLGVWCDVLEGGQLSVGDSVRCVTAAAAPA